MIKLLQGDCLELMKDIPDESIDLTVTMPPYGNNALWDEHVWNGVIKELFRVTKKGGVVVWIFADAIIKSAEIGTSFRQALFAIECGFNLHDTMIYRKPDAPLNHQRYNMFVFSNGKLTEPSKSALKKCTWTTKQDNIAHNYPATFPEKLAHYHIIRWSNPGDTVLDIFMGITTTGEMANILNRNFIGIELDKDYFDIANKRINDAKLND